MQSVPVSSASAYNGVLIALALEFRYTSLAGIHGAMVRREPQLLGGQLGRFIAGHAAQPQLSRPSSSITLRQRVASELPPFASAHRVEARSKGLRHDFSSAVREEVRLTHECG
jgi:hypothetical protein